MHKGRLPEGLNEVSVTQLIYLVRSQVAWRDLLFDTPRIRRYRLL